MKWLLKGVKALLTLAFMITFGLVVGVMVVIMPPLAWIGTVALTGVVLLWLMPDLPAVPEDLVRKLFFIAVIAQLVFPAYYAFASPGLPWISIRRVTWFPTLALAALTIAASSQQRARMTATLALARPIFLAGTAFFLSLVLSVFTSISFRDTLSAIWDASLYWAMTFFISILCVRDERTVKKFALILCALPLFAASMGVAEFLLQKRIFVSLWPDFLISQLAADSPMMFNNIMRDTFRNGQYRANYIYSVSLSFGEFLAMCGPIAAFFALQGRNLWLRAISCLSLLLCLVGIYTTGSRGAYTSLAVTLPLLTASWIVRYMRENPKSLIGTIAAATMTMFTLGFATLAFAWQKLRYQFTGGWEGAGSTDIRWLQWDLALPSIIANPITGYGFGVGGIVVGYITPGGTPSVDSYIITLLVDAGVPALVSFFAMIAFSIWMLMKVYLMDPHPQSEMALALAGSILSFGVYRLVLSQTENNFLFFLLLGLSVVQIAESRRRLAPPAQAQTSTAFSYRLADALASSRSMRSSASQ